MDFVAAHRDEHGVEPICAVLHDTAARIAPSMFYARTSPIRRPCARAVGDAELLPVIRQAHADNIGVYARARSTPNSIGPVTGWRAAPWSG